MIRLRNIPIAPKLTLLIMLTCTVVMILAASVFMIYEVVTFRRTTQQYTESIARIIAANAAPGLRFDDDSFAREILDKLKAEPTILMAGIYSTNGTMFAHFPEDRPLADFPIRPQDRGTIFSSRRMSVFHPIYEERKFWGTLYLNTDLTPMYERLRLYAGIVALVLGSLFFVALALSTWLQRRISRPILELAEMAKAVSIARDYTVRAKKHGNDELGLFTDAFNHMLTQIQEQNAAITRNEERLRLALQASQTGVWDWNLQTRQLVWDDYLYQLFGVPSGQFDGKLENFFQHVHPDDRARVRREIDRALEKKTEFRFDFRIIRANQKIHYLSSRGKTFYDSAGKAVRVTGVILDLTEIKESAKGLALLAAIVESSDDAIIGKNLDGTIVSWNSGAQRVYGYTAAETLGQPSSLVIPPDHLAEELKTLRRVKAGHTEHYETVRVRKNGDAFYASLTMSPIKDTEGKIIGASAISRDISERIQTEEEIRALNTQLEERVAHRTAELAATNKELEAFTYSVSHDLRAPLRHIDAFAQILEDELKTKLPGDGQRYIDRIRHGVQNMGRLVDDLLNLSRVGRLEIKQQTVRLNQLVEEAMADLKPEIGSRQIEWRIAPLPQTEGDPGLLKQVFSNLLSNAVKYTRPQEKAVIAVGAVEVEGETAVFIRDNGVGFNMKYADKLFGVFQRLHRAEDFEGTGVGLATVQRIVHLHHGRIWAEATLEQGATFYFTLQGMRPS